MILSYAGSIMSSMIKHKKDKFETIIIYDDDFSEIKADGDNNVHID